MVRVSRPLSAAFSVMAQVVIDTCGLCESRAGPIRSPKLNWRFPGLNTNCLTNTIDDSTASSRAFSVEMLNCQMKGKEP